MDIFIQIFTQIKNIFKRMSPIQRVNFVLLVSITVILIIFISWWMGRPNYVLLYSSLSTKDAAAIKARLDELKIPNQVRGNAIYVPQEKVYETRLLLANEGLPKGSGVGYEIFDKSAFGMTDYMQKLAYKRALEGELSRTISSIEGIKGCRVHLTMPQQRLFQEKGEGPSASVMLEKEGSIPLTKRQIGGIIHLVASSVEGLSPKNVTVVDNEGNLVSGMGEADSEVGLSATQLEIKQSVESYLEKKAESMLTRILGPGKAIVRVNATMDFSKVERTSERYDPESTVPRSEVRTEETSTEFGEKAGAGGKKAEKTVERVNTNYELSRTIERIVGASGTVKKLSIAVVVDGTYKIVESKEGKKTITKKEYVPRTLEEKEMYKKLVMSAVGFDATRGDEITISDAAFDTSYLEEEKKAILTMQKQKFIFDIVRQAGTIILFILTFVFLMIMLKKVTRVSTEVKYPSERQTQSVTVTPLGVSSGEVTPVSEMESFRNVALQNPEAIAQALREWLAEES